MATLWTTQTPAGSAIDSSYTLGNEFTIDTAGYVFVAVRYWKVDGTGVGFTRNVGLWAQATQTLLGSGSRVELSGDPSPGWVTVPLSSPVALSTSTLYVCGYTLQSGMSYPFTSHFYDVGLDNAPLHAPSGAGSFNSGSSVLVFPGSSFNNTGYFADPVAVIPSTPPLPPRLTVPVMRASIF